MTNEQLSHAPLDAAHTTLSPLISWCLASAGTCVNNTSVMMFKKGSFEIGATIYPVAMKVQYNEARLSVKLSFGMFFSSLFLHFCLFFDPS